MTNFFNLVDYKIKNFMVGALKVADWEPYNKKTNFVFNF